MNRENDFTRRLVRLISDSKQSQAAIGRAAGLSTSQMNRIVKAVREPTRPELEALAKALGKTVAELVGETLPKAMSAQPAKVQATAEEDIPREEWAEGLAHYLDQYGDRIGKSVQDKMKQSQFHTEGVLFDDFFWDNQRCSWERSLGLSSGTPWVERPKTSSPGRP